MSINGIIIAIIVVGGIGCFIGVFLSIAAHKFSVEVDEKEELILKALPGNNCGGCGYPGCSGLAKAISEGNAPTSGCPVGGQKVALEIAKIMGIEAKEETRMCAFVACNGTNEACKKDYLYDGINSCLAASLMQTGSDKSCKYGCLGYGDCLKVCDFDAITIVDGISKIDKDKCKVCGKCIKACPKHIIKLVPYEGSKIVACSSKDKGAIVNKICTNGCIGCGICEKNCEHDAVHVIDNVAVIDFEKCTNCGMCKEKCPKKCLI